MQLFRAATHNRAKPRSLLMQLSVRLLAIAQHSTPNVLSGPARSGHCQRFGAVKKGPLQPTQHLPNKKIWQSVRNKISSGVFSYLHQPDEVGNGDAGTQAHNECTQR